jgi:hypothetical protein
MAKTQPDEQYTPRGAKIPIPERGEFRCHLDHVLWVGVTSPTHFGRATIVAGYAVARSPKRPSLKGLTAWVRG